MRKIQVLTSRDGNINLKVDNILLHSNYYPERDGEKFVEGNLHLIKGKDTVVIYGLALGYHIKSILKNANKNSKIYIFDLDSEVVQIGKKLKVYDEILLDKRVEIFTEFNEEFNIVFSNLLNKVEDIIIYKPSLKTMPRRFDSVQTILNNYLNGKKGINKFRDIMMLNKDINEKKDYTVIDELINNNNFDVKNKPIVCVSSGPSLDKSINELKEIRDKVIVLSVGSALKGLVKNDILPDLITITDCQKMVKKQLEGLEGLDVPLCFLNTASYWAVESYNGPKYIFFNEENMFSNIIMTTGKTVAVSNIDIAIKLKTKIIGLLGQDLAYLDHKTHSDSYIEIYGKSNYISLNSKVYKEALNVKKEKVYTTTGFINFKYNIESLISKNSNIVFLNCSNGLPIEGTTYTNIKNIINL
ncbi:MULTISPECIES: motility associated factor glycosyltransferase family protein [unclassified Clostridium]|uniref:motility associated factor glycosyltransferase family protein n=1 Tax=unclassified Clostridium TaxID=2614128 RepID=UPI0025B7E7F5|nr:MULTISPECIES: 6-hydroxymethylpterin diphosphokinase MptE-like protein [unclassified Clostridium]